LRQAAAAKKQENRPLKKNKENVLYRPAGFWLVRCARTTNHKRQSTTSKAHPALYRLCALDMRHL
jgi:hypothetical protein